MYIYNVKFTNIKLVQVNEIKLVNLTNLHVHVQQILINGYVE